MKRSLLILLSLLVLSGCATPSPPEPEVEDNDIIVIEGPESQYTELLLSMSLEEKVAQMLMSSCHEEGSAQRAAEFGVGALCLYADAFQGKTADEVRQMCAELQALSSTPLLLCVDEEGGTVCRVSLNPELRAYRFLSPRELFETGGWELVDLDAEERSRLLLDLGLNVNLAPVCDVPLSADDYIYPRCFSLDHTETMEYVSRTVREMKEQGIGCTLKHFPGYGGSTDTHCGLAYDNRPYEAFLRSDFLPFVSGLEAGADSVLVSHNIVECIDATAPASLSAEIHRILREDLGFQGVIITDDLFMDAITQFTGGENAAVPAVLAGNDMLCCADFEESAAAILAAVEAGTVSTEQIDRSVFRILQWKAEIGLDIFGK